MKSKYKVQVARLVKSNITNEQHAEGVDRAEAIGKVIKNIYGKTAQYRVWDKSEQENVTICRGYIRFVRSDHNDDDTANPVYITIEKMGESANV